MDSLNDDKYRITLFSGKIFLHLDPMWKGFVEMYHDMVPFQSALWVDGKWTILFSVGQLIHSSNMDGHRGYVPMQVDVVAPKQRHHLIWHRGLGLKLITEPTNAPSLHTQPLLNHLIIVMILSEARWDPISSYFVISETPNKYFAICKCQFMIYHGLGVKFTNLVWNPWLICLRLRWASSLS